MSPMQTFVLFLGGVMIGAFGVKNDVSFPMALIVSIIVGVIAGVLIS